MFNLATFMSIIAFVEKLAPVVRTALPDLISAGTAAVETKGSPASIATLGTAVASTAAAVGLSSEDQANVQHVASAVAGMTPVVQMLAAAGLGATHVDAINSAAAVLTAAAQGVMAVVPDSAAPTAA